AGLMKTDSFFKIGNICLITSGNLINGSVKKIVSGFSIDTRTLNDADIFIPLPGENCDGHVFITKAFEKGAEASFVKSDIEGVFRKCLSDKALIEVQDPLNALQILAERYRSTFSGDVIAVTGSNGKTTTKDWIKHLMGNGASIHATSGTRNNHIGLPLTVLGLRKEHICAVFELGVNHIGEMNVLGNIAKPDIAVITNVGPSHLEGFKTIENISAEKGSLLSFLQGKNIAVLNSDDSCFMSVKAQTAGSVITFGIDRPSFFSASKICQENEKVVFLLSVDGKDKGTIKINGSGKFNVYNFLAAAAAAFAAGESLENIINRSKSLIRPSSRWQCFSYEGIHIIDDAYNANPESMRTALDAFNNMKIDGKKYFVCGSMMELGVGAADAHTELGCEAAEQGMDILIAVGDFSEYVVNGFLKIGSNSCKAWACENRKDAASLINETIEPGDGILLKGSRKTAMEKLIPLIQRGIIKEKRKDLSNVI
ncbi:MAG: UDP-N-acetylmuramoyl-tripeptide--D-alanyl-D-alanine ligase, partial [Candidatus Theseobacter exili]|nr:UDP-N-acetylmuramoyl-tripeptide--D-alanyl-D-alanine ligase [Candidatus Theseobacter exili]